MKTKFYVTTPIYYVNDKPHIGHAYTTVFADVLARYHRLLGIPTYFLTGTDEHGQKVQRAAERAGVTPQQHADGTVVRFLDLWRKLGITYDDFIRTTEDRHKTVVKKILQDLYDRGEIYRAEYDGWYCVTCERFYTEKDLTDGKCPEAACGRVVDQIKESNYFFRMSRHQDWLIRYIGEHPEFIQPDFRRNETLGFLRKELTDLCISRPKSRLSWGVELPFDSNFVTYVWFDALVNYISAVGYLSDPDMFAKWWPASCHLIGKDILTTHTVYWPIMLNAMSLPMPQSVFAHGWWLAGESKMSKTDGNAIDPAEFSDRYGADAFRYFLMAEMIPGQDASFTEEAFIRRYNCDLANDLGNVLSRVMKMVSSYCGGAIPESGEPGADEESLRTSALACEPAMRNALESLRLDHGISAVTAAVRETNRYIEKSRPWELAKLGKKLELNTVLYHAAEVLRIVSGLLSPIMPGKMAELRGALGIGNSSVVMDDLGKWGRLTPGVGIGGAFTLFPRIASTDSMSAAAPVAEAVTVTAEKELNRDNGKQQIEGVMQIEYADFQKIELKTARILAAERVEGADKLLRLDVNVGDEKRQIVAGIAQFYKPEDIVGRLVVVVTNLKPRKIRNVESNGMLLAASTEGCLRLVSVDGEIATGATVK